LLSPSRNADFPDVAAVSATDCEYPQGTAIYAMHARRRRIQIIAVAEQFEQYCEAHPRGPAAVRRPRLVRRGAMWVALLGENVQSGIVGLGSTVESALRAFDTQYLNALRPRIAA
jgi:hypothetical protein